MLSCLRTGGKHSSVAAVVCERPSLKRSVGLSLCAQREGLGGRTDFFTLLRVKVVLVCSLSCSFAVKGWEVLSKGFL